MQIFKQIQSLIYSRSFIFSNLMNNVIKTKNAIV